MCAICVYSLRSGYGSFSVSIHEGERSEDRCDEDVAIISDQLN